MSREGDFQRHFVCVFFARRPRKNFARELHEMAQFVLKIVHLTTFVFRWKQPHYSGTQFKEKPRDWQNLFAITRFRYIEVIFHIFHYHWSKENCSSYRGLHYRGLLYRSSTAMEKIFSYGLLARLWPAPGSLNFTWANSYLVLLQIVETVDVWKDYCPWKLGKVAKSSDLKWRWRHLVDTNRHSWQHHIAQLTLSSWPKKFSATHSLLLDSQVAYVVYATSRH